MLVYLAAFSLPGILAVIVGAIIISLPVVE